MGLEKEVEVDSAKRLVDEDLDYTDEEETFNIYCLYRTHS